MSSMSYHSYDNNYQHSYNDGGEQNFSQKWFQVEPNINSNSQQVNYQQYDVYYPVKMAENSQTLNEPSRHDPYQIVLGTNQHENFFFNDTSSRFSTTNHAISQNQSQSERTFEYQCDPTSVSVTDCNENIDELCRELSITITPEIFEKITSLTANDACQDQNHANVDCAKNYPNISPVDCIDGQVPPVFIETNNDCNMLNDLELFERQMIASQPTVNPFPVPVDSNCQVICYPVENQMNMPLQFDSALADDKNVEKTSTPDAYVTTIEQNAPSVQSISPTYSNQHETETTSYTQMQSSPRGRELLKPGARAKDPKNEGRFTNDGENFFFGKKACPKHDSNGQKNPVYVSKRSANNSSVKKHRKKETETEKQINELINNYNSDIEKVLSQIKGLVTRVTYIPKDVIPDNIINIIDKYQQ